MSDGSTTENRLDFWLYFSDEAADARENAQGHEGDLTRRIPR